MSIRARWRRIAPAVVGVLGAIALLILGAIGNQWLLELKYNSGIAMDYDTMPPEFESYHFLLQMTVFLSLMCGLLGLVFSVLLLWGKGGKWMNASLISFSGALPLVLWGVLCSRVSGAVILPPILLLAGGLAALILAPGMVRAGS